MNARDVVWIERVDSRIVRIFRGTHSDDWKRAMVAGTLETCPKRDAVGEIRKFVWNRCGGRCEWCGKPVTETGPLWRRMHCHEGLPKGKAITPTGDPGEVSIWNCVGLCQKCHENDPRAHGNRRPQWSGKTFEEVMEGE